MERSRFFFPSFSLLLFHARFRLAGQRYLARERMKVGGSKKFLSEDGNFISVC